MTIILKQLFSFFRLLNSDTGTNSLAAGLACGVILGFAPFLSLQTFLLLTICFLFRIQLGAALLSAFVFKFAAYVFDPVSDQIGRVVLESQGLRPLFVDLYNLPLVPLTRFNNSIVMGAGVVSFALVLPLFFVFRRLIVKYRETVVAKYKQSKIWKAWAGTSLYQWYAKYNQLYGSL